MSVEEVAAVLGLTVGRVRQLARAGTLKGDKLGRDWYFLPADVEHFAEHRPPRGRPRKNAQ